MKSSEETAATAEAVDEHDQDTSGDENDDYVPTEAFSERVNGTATPSDITAATSDLTLDETPAASGAETPSKPKLGKAKQKKAKKAAQQAESNDGSLSENSCVVCNASFASKTKLFQHIKKTNHVALKTEVESATKTKKNNKKR